MNIGEKIRSLREQHGISQQELSDQVKCTPSMICQIERGTKVPTILLANEIAEVFGCTVDELLKPV